MKNEKLASTPPMGWNSWDCYGASVTEDEVLANARFMAEHMRDSGWEYVVVDTSWYEPTIRGSLQAPFAGLEMDGFSRLIPAENRFPSSAQGAGFAPLAERIHAMGLEFGIHIMRGVPRIAVHRNTALMGTEVRARDIADPASVCSWNTYMYGVDPFKPGAWEYYRSMFELYTQWGVDFVKLDDASCTGGGLGANPYAARHELDLIREALEACGRPMVLSLSPGPAPREEAKHLARVGEMWRISADFWDTWKELRHAFDLCRDWQGVGVPGAWPDADMLPLGRICLRSEEAGQGARHTRFTPDEQKTLMALWCLFRSPLMMGGDLPTSSPETIRLLTHPGPLSVLRRGRNPRETVRSGDGGQLVVWEAEDCDGHAAFIGVFNLWMKEQTLAVPLRHLSHAGASLVIEDLFEGGIQTLGDPYRLEITIPSHGVFLGRISPQLKA